MKSNIPFLTAEWRELTLVNYALEPDFLQSFLPAGLVPDLREGQAWASLVAFDFENIRVAGVPWPGYTHFPEFNLRVYVRCQEARRRGVFFIKELIPGKIPALIARWSYNEPYASCPMQRQRISAEDGSQSQFTSWVWEDKVNQVDVRVGPETYALRPGSSEEWFTDQQWGFGLDHGGDLLRYHVDHPHWLFRQVHDLNVEIDWLGLYGPVWAQTLRKATPRSTVHAIGSEVAVFRPVVVDRPNFS